MKEIQLISAADASVNITSVHLDLGDIVSFSIHCSFTLATLGGTLSLEASNDNSDWVPVSGASQTIASGASHMFNVINAAYRCVRVTWVQTGGTGTLTANAVIKENTTKGG